MICVSTIITEWYNSTKKEEVYEMYQSGYYDTIEQRGSHVEIEKMNLFSPPVSILFSAMTILSAVFQPIK